MGNERRVLGARAAAGNADTIRGAGEGGSSAVVISNQIRWEPGVPGDAGRSPSACLFGQNRQLLKLAFMGNDGRIVHFGGSGAYVHPGRRQVDTPPNLQFTAESISLPGQLPLRNGESPLTEQGGDDPG